MNLPRRLEMKRPGLLISLALLAALPAYADSAGPKNREGNRLFERGQYEEAQKAYLEAQAEAPDRPELFYNLGNTLIKQKKYEHALQSLRQAAAKGDRGLQASSWFNMGNALFEAGNFGASAQAYVQCLRMNPADRDAKHNLELALKKMQEEQQSQPNPRQNQDKNSEKPEAGQNQQAESKEDKSRPEKGGQAQSSQDRRDSPRPATPESTQTDRRDASLSKERAMQILDALQNQEMAEQRKLLERRARRKATGKDW